MIGPTFESNSLLPWIRFGMRIHVNDVNATSLCISILRSNESTFVLSKDKIMNNIGRLLLLAVGVLVAVLCVSVVF